MVGGIKRYATACDAQAFCQGFYYIAEAGEKLRRSLEYRHDRGAHFYPFDSRPGFRLGIDYSALGLARDGRRRRTAQGAAWVESMSSKKHKQGEALCRVPSQAIKRRVHAL